MTFQNEKKKKEKNKKKTTKLCVVSTREVVLHN